MYIAVQIAKRWKQPKCPSVDEWINKLWYIHTMEYYSIIKKNEVLIHATMWVNLKKNYGKWGFPGGAVVESLPADAGDTSSSPGLGGSHMPRSNLGL